MAGSVTVVDASALAAVVFREAGSDRVADRLRGASVAAPHLLKHEMANVALVKARRDPASAARVMMALETALAGGFGIHWYDVDHTDAALIALATGLTAYDASYLWLAGSLEADLVTLDRSLRAAGRAETIDEG
jgi:predicted nucleic acid-binding protein